MTVSDTMIISGPCNNTSAEPIDSRATAPRLWDHGRSTGLLIGRSLPPARRRRNAAHSGGFGPAMSPPFMESCACVLSAFPLPWNDVQFSKLH